MPTFTHPTLLVMSYTPYGFTLPSSLSLKLYTLTSIGSLLGRNSLPPFLKFPTNSFFFVSTVLHQLDQKIIYPYYDFKHLTEKYFEIGMKLNDFSIQLVKY